LKRFLCGPFILVSAVFLLAVAYDLWCEHTLIGDIWNFPLDDSWIHMTFGRNFASGLGFGVNPHEPAAASTSVIWTLWVALVHLIFQNAGLKAIITVVKGTGVFFSLLSLAGILRIFAMGNREAPVLIVTGLMP